MSVAWLLLGLWGCDDVLWLNRTEPVAGNDACAIYDAFAANCTACHSSASALGGLDLQTDPYAALVGQPSATDPSVLLVSPGDPDASLLVLKLAGSQAGDQGDVMPPSGVDDALAKAARTWVADGASDCAGGTSDTGTADYHPDGFSDPAVHGRQALLQEQRCTDCHGATLQGNGAALSCDTCHPSGWRTDCTFCHGGEEDGTGAPPVGVGNTAPDDPYGEHAAHVTDGLAAGFDCVQCHLKPADVLSEGHFMVGDDTPGVAEMDFSGGLSTQAVWSGAGCTNVYCHGVGIDDDGSRDVGDPITACNNCHPSPDGDRDIWAAMSGQHWRHLEHNMQCRECHTNTVDGGPTIIDVTLHVNGDPNLAFGEELDMRIEDGLCTGICHAENHSPPRAWIHEEG